MYNLLTTRRGRYGSIVTVDEDLFEYLAEMSYEVERGSKASAVEFWELVQDWINDVQR